MVKLNDVYPVNQTWDQLINLDRDSDEVRQAFAASIVPAASVPAAGGSAAAASVPPTATTKATKYCFIQGKRAHHTSSQCKMIKPNLRAYPYDASNTKTFDTADQVKKEKLTTSSATEVKEIGKGNEK